MSAKILIFEGKECTWMRGWRHYQIRTQDGFRNCIGRPIPTRNSAIKTGAKFYAAGTWESDRTVPDDTMPVPKSEILREVFDVQRKLVFEMP